MNKNIGNDNSSPEPNIAIQDHSQNVHKMNNTTYLKEGMFCRSLIDVENFCLVDDVLLITELNFADNKLHSVELIAHPRYNTKAYNKYLLDNFYNLFTVISKNEAEKNREDEEKLILSRYFEQKKVVDDLGSNPEKLKALAMEIYAKRIEPKENDIEPVAHTNNVLALIKGGNLNQSIQAFKESMESHSDVIQIATNILLKESTKLQKIFEETLPYNEQKILAVKVSTLEHRQQRAKIQEGLENLRLYTGDTVTIEPIKKGKSAPSHMPLTMVQKVLIANLELALHDVVHAETLDIYSEKVFLDELKNNQSLVDQIFPTERSMVLMALRNTDRSYGDPFDDRDINGCNKAVFILVRDGENIYQVFSPISSHAYAESLFPSRTALDEIFKCGELDITVDNLYYSSAFSRLEQEILHYKRFLLLIIGLDHNHKLFGEFYPHGKKMEMFKPSFQNEYFDFIHDADGENLLESGFNESIGDWISKNNSKITIGSKILINVSKYMNEYNAPRCYKETYLGYNRTATPTNDIQYVQVQEDENGLFVRAEFYKSDYDGQTSGKPFTTRISLENDFETANILLLNNINPTHILQFINNRKYRSYIFSFIEIFKCALNVLSENFKLIEPLYNQIYEAVKTLPNLLPMDNEQLEMEIIDSINLWQTQKKKSYATLSKKMQSKALIEICDALYLRVTSLREDMLNHALSYMIEDASPLKLTVAFDGSLYLYTTMPVSEQESRICPHASVYRYGFKPTNTGTLELISTEIVFLSKFLNCETLLIDLNPELTSYWFDVSKPYSIRTRKKYEIAPFESHEDKVFILNEIDSGYNTFKDLLTPNPLINITENIDFINDVVFEYNQIKKFTTPVIALPIAIFDRKVVIACVENTNDFIKSMLKNEQPKPQFNLKTTHVCNYSNIDCRFVLPKSEIRSLIDSDKMMPNIFATSIPSVIDKGLRINESYFPMSFDNFFSKDDPFVFDKFIENPFYRDDMSLVNVCVFCETDQEVINNKLVAPTKFDLYLLVGKDAESDTFKEIANSRSDLNLPASFHYSIIENVVYPYNLDSKILGLIKFHTQPNQNLTNTISLAIKECFISSVKQVYEKEIPIELEKFKGMKLYKLLKQL